MPKNGGGISNSALYDLLHQHLSDNHYNKTETDNLLAAIEAFSYQGVFDPTSDTLPVPTSINKGNYWLVDTEGTYETIELHVGDMMVLYFISAEDKGWNKLDNTAPTTTMLKANNLSDVADAATARTNLNVAPKASTFNLNKAVYINGSGELQSATTTAIPPQFSLVFYQIVILILRLK